MPTLILTLPLALSGPAAEYDYVQTLGDQQPVAQGRAPAALLPAQGPRGADVVAVVPARALSWHRIALPERVLRSILPGRSDAARVRGVLAGVLEEQLLDEPEQLHFAVFSDPAAGSGDSLEAWVAVCSRSWLQASLQALEAAGHAVGRIVAECTPSTPSTGGTASAWVSADMEPAQLLLCSAQGVSLLPLLPATAGLAQAETGLEVFAEPAVMALAQSSFGNQVTLQTRAQRLLNAAQSPWNLAQLELSASPGNRLQKRVLGALQQVLHAPAWRPLRWGLLALVLVQLVAVNALAWQQRRALQAQRDTIQAVLQQSFPEVRLVIDAPLQMQRAVDDLARARGQGSDTDVARVLSTIAAQAPQGLALSALDVSDQQLRLRFSGLDAAAEQPLLGALAARGLRAQLQDGLLLVTREAR